MCFDYLWAVATGGKDITQDMLFSDDWRVTSIRMLKITTPHTIKELMRCLNVLVAGRLLAVYTLKMRIQTAWQSFKRCNPDFLVNMKNVQRTRVSQWHIVVNLLGSDDPTTQYEMTFRKPRIVVLVVMI